MSRGVTISIRDSELSRAFRRGAGARKGNSLSQERTRYDETHQQATLHSDRRGSASCTAPAPRTPTRSRTGTRSCRRRSAPPTNPFFQARSAAIVQLAVFEAVNAIVGDYEPYLGTIVAPPGASPDAAAIAAAHRTLVALHPGSAAALDTLRAQSLAAIPDGPAKEAGIAVGEAAAAAMLLLRADDGWRRRRALHAGDRSRRLAADAARVRAGAPARLGPGDPVRPRGGLAVPPAAAARAPHGQVRERLQRGQGGRPGRQPVPPAGPHRCRALLRRRHSGAAVEPGRRQASAAQGKTLSENARIFALLAMAMADGSIAMFDTKYHYNFWRPVTAIRAGDLDGNRRTDPDPDWLPLIPTPPFPSYPSAHATLLRRRPRGARAGLRQGRPRHHADHSPLPAVVLNYTAWKQITDDIDDARIYGGIHFRFDQEAGDRSGTPRREYILEELSAIRMTLTILKMKKSR